MKRLFSRLYPAFLIVTTAVWIVAYCKSRVLNKEAKALMAEARGWAVRIDDAVLSRDAALKDAADEKARARLLAVELNAERLRKEAALGEVRWCEKRLDECLEEKE